jgi:hypothetical protein
MTDSHKYSEIIIQIRIEIVPLILAFKLLLYLVLP